MLPHNSILYYEDFKYEENSELRDFIDSGKASEFLEKIGRKIILVLGWDGSMLAAIHTYHWNKIPFLGINYGNTGFLLNDKNVTEEIEFICEAFPLISAELHTWNGEIKKFVALNEIDIRSARWRVLQLDIEISDSGTLSLLWDGTVISTPTWSTAYNRSLGWPILPRWIDAFIITPKAPIHPRGQTSVILADDKILEIHTIGGKNKFHIYGDGKEILWDSDEEITLILKKSEVTVEFLIGKDYASQWNSKVMKEQGLQTNK